MRVFTRLLKEVKQFKKQTYFTMLFAGVEVVADIMVPILMALIIDRGVATGNMQAVYYYGALMFGTVLVGLATGVLAGKYAAVSSAGLSYNIRKAMFGNIQTFSFSNIDKFSSSSLITRLTTDVSNIQNSFMMMIRIGVRAPMTFVSALTMTLIIEPRISGVFLVVIAFLILSMALMIRSTLPIFNQVFAEYDILNRNVQENITAIRAVKGFAREEYEISRFNCFLLSLYKKFVKAEGIIAFINPVVMTAIYTCILGVSWFGAHFVVSDTLTTGALSTLFSYIMSILMALMMMSMMFVMLTISYVNMKRVVEVLDENAEIINPDQAITSVKDGSIQLKDVNFAYRAGAEKYVLSDINLDIKSGETIGIIGSTGCSKTSLINLFSRLYDVSAGLVKIGGIDVTCYDLTVLRDQVAVVLQKNELFTGTILENLRWGNPEATLEACVSACQVACAHDFIKAMPDGYNTLIERGGSNVSGGQKQRLCIARALLKQPKILILDDSTSAVDTATDQKIRAGFYTKIPNTTIIIIAQRIASIKSADRIVVLEDGKINGIGTHDELAKQNDIYKMINVNQQNDVADFDKKGA